MCCSSRKKLYGMHPRGCKNKLNLHQHLSFGSVHTWVYLQAPSFLWPQLVLPLSAAAQRQPLVPSVWLWQEKKQLVFYLTANKDKYHNAAQPFHLPPTQYIWWAICCPGHVLLRCNRLIWINSHLPVSRGRVSINILAPQRLFPQNGARSSAVCYSTCYTVCSHSCSVEESISPWLDNKTISPSPRGSRQSKSNSTKTARSTERKREWHTKKDKSRERGKTALWAESHTHKKTIAHPFELRVDSVQHNLLDSHDSESNILLYRHRPPTPDALREEHQSKLNFWTTTLIPGSSWPALCLYPLAMRAKSVDPSAPCNLFSPFVTERDSCCQSQHRRPNTALSCLVLSLSARPVPVL